MRRSLALLASATLMFVAVPSASADDPPLPEFATGHLYSRAGWMSAYDVDDIQNPVVEHVWPNYVIPHGSSLAFDAAGYMYAPVSHPSAPGLFVYDPDPATWDFDGHWYYEPVGYAPVPADQTIRGLVLRHDDTQAIGCGTWAGLLHVFDVTDKANPLLERTIDLSGIYQGWNCALAFDADGDLWASAYGQLVRLELDELGNVIAHTRYPGLGGNPQGIAFEDGSDHLFFTAVNADFVSVRDRFDPNSSELARITDVCGGDIHNPQGIVFDSSGNLFVGCDHVYSAPDSDVVIFSAGSLAGLSGTVAAADLGPVRISGAHSGGYLAFRPADDPAALIAELIDEVEALNLANGIANSLDAKLATAVRALEDLNQNNDQAAIGKLEAFVNEVQAQSGSTIPTDDADRLVALARKIITLIAGG